MKYLVLTYLIFIGTAQAGFSKSILERRLDFRYEINQGWCYNLAKAKISKGVKEPKAYYYASLIKLEHSRNELKVTRKYFDIKESLLYARRLKRMVNKRNGQAHTYDSLFAHVLIESKLILDELNEIQQNQKALRLQKKITQFEDKKSNPSNVKLVDRSDDKRKIEISESTLPKNFNGSFYGLANGTELVPIYSLEREKLLISILNKERKKRGMSELIWDDKLAQAARYHACDMATQNYFSHDSKDRVGGKLVTVGGTFERIRKFYSESFVNSENISAGRSTAQGTYTGWYNSPGHYKNMFNSSSKKVGVGLYHDPQSFYKYYWVFCTAQ